MISYFGRNIALRYNMYILQGEVGQMQYIRDENNCALRYKLYITGLPGTIGFVSLCKLYKVEFQPHEISVRITPSFMSLASPTDIYFTKISLVLQNRFIIFCYYSLYLRFCVHSLILSMMYDV